MVNRSHVAAAGFVGLVSLLSVQFATAAGIGEETGARYSCAAAKAAGVETLSTNETIDEQLVAVTLPPVVECLPGLKAAVRSWIDDYVDTTVRFGEQFSDTERDEFLDMAREASQGGFAWSHDIAIEQEFGNDAVVSLLASIWSYTGGAHGNGFFVSMVWDVEAGDMIELADLFQPETNWLETIATFVREDLYRQKHQVGTFLSGDEEDPFIEDGTAADAENFKAFGIYGNEAGDAKGLTFHFAPYAVGAFAEGDFHVNVPAIVFDALLAEDKREFFQ